MFLEKYQTDMGSVTIRLVNAFTRLPPSRYFSVRSMLEKYLSCIAQSPIPGTHSSRLLSHSPLTLFSNTTMSASAGILATLKQIKLYFKDNMVYNFRDKQPIRISAHHPGADSVVYKEDGETFCQVDGISKTKGQCPMDCLITWKNRGKQRLDDRLRFWSPKAPVYDHTCPHPEFPHLISGRQAGRD